MPDPQGRPRASRPTPEHTTPRPQQIGNPSWFAPVMTGLMVLGVLWVATFYISGGSWPAPIGYWNLAVGLGSIMAGFVMATRWR